MDEALLTGRFSVQPDMTRRGMSAKSFSRSGSTSDCLAEVQGDPDSRDTSSRARPISRSSSRADTCLRRTRSAFDVELFRSQLRLNKSLSRNRFKQELLDLAIHPAGTRTCSSRAEPEGSEVNAGPGSAREGGDRATASLDQPAAFADSPRFKPDKVNSPLATGRLESDDTNEPDTGNGEETKVNFDIEDKWKSEDSQEEAFREEPGGPTPPRGERWDVPAEEGTSPVKEGGKRGRRKRSEGSVAVVTSRRVGPRNDRLDGAIIIKPQRRTRRDVSSEVMSPRRFSLRRPATDGASSPASSLFCYSTSSGSEDEDMAGLGDHGLGSSPLHGHASGRTEGDGGEACHTRVGGSSSVLLSLQSDSDKYDTDCEVDDQSEFRQKERNRSATCMDADFGHLTYEAACARFNVVPRKRIVEQLTTQRLQVNFCGLSKMETKAVALALLHNSRLDEVDLSSNGMTGTSIAYISDSFQQNIFITKLNLGGNTIEETGAKALGEMLKTNIWMTHLNLSDCGITDLEIAFLAKGLQENSTVICLNLSKNKIEIHGGRHLGTALVHNNGVECLNLSWNMLRGGGAVAVCNSLQKNHTLRELNLAWNGLGFQGSLAISEGLKVNRTLTKLDLSSNRVDWECTPYLAKALTYNRSLQVLELGHNPISMDGCLKLLEAIDRPTSQVRFISLANIPISNKVAFKATEISKQREFSMEHGGVISTRDVFGIKRVRREDPLTLLIRYLSTMGIRVVDLFRVFDTDSKLYVSQANFIRGLKRVRAPLDEEDMLRVARRMRSDKRGDISYQELAANVRSHIREERKEDLRLQQLENKKREERRRILQSDMPLYAPPSFSYLPALYSMYPTDAYSRNTDEVSPARTSRMDSVVSRRGHEAHVQARGKTPGGSFLPTIDTPASPHTSPFRRDLRTPSHPFPSRSALDGRMTVEYGRRSPMTLVRHGTKGMPGSRRPVSLVRADSGDRRRDKTGSASAATSAKQRRSRGSELSSGGPSPGDQSRSPQSGSHSHSHSHSRHTSSQGRTGKSSGASEGSRPVTESGQVPGSLPRLSVSKSLVADGGAVPETTAVERARHRDVLRGVSPDTRRVAVSGRGVRGYSHDHRGL